MTGTWEQAAREAANTLDEWVAEEAACGADFGSIRQTEWYIDILKNDETHLGVESLFRKIAENGLGMYLAATGETFQWALDGVLATLIAKQHDYGHDNIEWGGRFGLVLRIHDKVARIKNLSKSFDLAVNEPLVDSYLDLCGYGIIGIMVERGTFGLPLSAGVV